MTQQTLIDEFFKSTSSKWTLNSVIKTKKNSGLRNLPYSRNRKKNSGKTQNIPLSQYKVQSDSELDCEVIFEKINNTYALDEDDIQILVQDEEEIGSKELSIYKNEYLDGSSKEMIDYEHELSPIIGTLSTIDTEALNNDEIYLKTPKRESKVPLSVNRGMLENNVKLKETIKRDLTENSPSTTDKTSVSNNDNNFYLNGTPNKNLKTPDKKDVWTGIFNNSTSKKSNYSPKVPSSKPVRNIKARKLFNHTIDDDVITQAIEYMNLAKQNAILPNNFDLEAIYSSGTFNYNYNHIDTKTSMKYELNEITFSTDLKSNILITTIFTVFSNPVNCGYFDQNELDFIYSILTLPVKAQMLLSRMISRKRTWHRKSGIKYETEIAPDLKDIFEILAARSICTFDIENENLSNILELLQADELRRLCQNMKINPNGKKESNIIKLIQLSKKKSLFPGMKCPSSALYTCIFNILDYCVRITDNTWNIIDRILTLLIPNGDPQKSTADIFFMLYDIYKGNKIYPKSFANHFPIFSSKLHLLTYVEARSKLFTVLQFIEKKNWKMVQEYGNFAMDILPNILKNESLRLQSSTLPMHVRRFMRGYTWLKILSKSIDAFKKNKDKKRVVEILKFLIDQDCHMHTRKGAWYNELALIEMFHHKNIEASAVIIMQALEEGNLTQVHKIELIERGNNILKKKRGVDTNIKAQISKVLDDHAHHMPKYEATTNIIDASLMPRNTAGNKSVWCIETNTDSQSYGSVESLALYHYCKREFSNGLHCEGALPILLFVTLFWEELYDMRVPGAFVTLYQEAPEDLYTDQFYENRKEQIDMKFQILNNLDSESLSTLMESKFKKYSQYESIMPSNLLKYSSYIKEISHCLGVEGVIGICKRLIHNYKLWKAGFPDLIVWNADTKQYKIVEVKGPKDTLSTKQRLWLEYLNVQLRLNTEVCLVQDKNSAKRSRERVEEFSVYE